MKLGTSIRLFAVGLAAVVICSMSIAVASSDDWRKDQKIWWNDSQLVKGALVGYLKLLNSNPGLLGKENPLWQVNSQLLILDSRNDRTTLNVLASLSSYRLGASGGEVYQCVLRRKGSKILPQLQNILASGKNECAESIGRNAPSCQTTSEHETWLKDTIVAIKADRSCTIDQ